MALCQDLAGAHQGATCPRQAPSAPGVALACPRSSCGPGPADAGSPQEDTCPTPSRPGGPDRRPRPHHRGRPRRPAGGPRPRQLRTRAKELRRGVHRGAPADVALLAAHHPRWAGLAASDPARAEVTLRDAQLALARSLGFEGWQALVQRVGRRRVEERGMHRWFAVEFNNEVWDLIDAGVGPVSPEADRDLVLYGAYASARHWTECGGPAQQARAEHLVARACLAVGDPAGRAAACSSLPRPRAGTPGRRRRLGRPVRSRGARPGARGDRRRRRGRGGTATSRVRLTAEVADALDREVLEGTVAAGPWFGLEARG